jgi:hypothetical protein
MGESIGLIDDSVGMCREIGLGLGLPARRQLPC